MDNLIPTGPYCYTWRNGSGITLCPYWRQDNAKPLQQCGCCIKYGVEDTDSPFSLLWDQIKCHECYEVNVFENNTE